MNQYKYYVESYGDYVSIHVVNRYLRAHFRLSSCACHAHVRSWLVTCTSELRSVRYSKKETLPTDKTGHIKTRGLEWRRQTVLAFWEKCDQSEQSNFACTQSVRKSAGWGNFETLLPLNIPFLDQQTWIVWFYANRAFHPCTRVKIDIFWAWGAFSATCLGWSVHQLTAAKNSDQIN